MPTKIMVTGSVEPENLMFPYVGTKEDNRNPMLEALVTNLGASYKE